MFRTIITFTMHEKKFCCEDLFVSIISGTLTGKRLKFSIFLIFSFMSSVMITNCLYIDLYDARPLYKQ